MWQMSDHEYSVYGCESVDMETFMPCRFILVYHYSVNTSIRSPFLFIYKNRYTKAEFNIFNVSADQYLGQSCSYQRPRYQSSKNSLLVQFTTDGSTTKQGFMLQYVARKGICNCTYLYLPYQSNISLDTFWYQRFIYYKWSENRISKGIR